MLPCDNAGSCSGWRPRTQPAARAMPPGHGQSVARHLPPHHLAHAQPCCDTLRPAGALVRVWAVQCMASPVPLQWQALLDAPLFEMSSYPTPPRAHQGPAEGLSGPQLLLCILLPGLAIEQSRSLYHLRAVQETAWSARPKQKRSCITRYHPQPPHTARHRMYNMCSYLAGQVKRLARHCRLVRRAWCAGFGARCGWPGSAC